MFDFLFKRSRKKPETERPVNTAAEAERSQEKRQRRQAEQASQREAARARLELLSSDADLLSFILSCEHAELRLQAAQRLQGAEALQQVQQALRNSDRRVSRLAQARVRQMEAEANQRQQVQSCLERAQQLLQVRELALNKVAELDHDWQALAVADGSASQQFVQLRTALGERLRAQSDLQRGLAQALAELRRLQDQEEDDASAALRQLEQLANEVALYSAADEAHALNKHLLAQFAEQYAQAHKRLQARERQLAMVQEREGVLLAWEAADPASLLPSELKRQWAALPSLPEAALQPLQQRFSALLQGLRPARPAASDRPAPDADAQPEASVPPQDADSARAAFSNSLHALEQALDEGLLQVAANHDRILRQLDLAVVRPTSAQMQQLTQLRSELTRLRDWARWGGNVSREELVRAVEELPALQLPVNELARRIGSSRERWKSLDHSSGPAAKGLWERFDAACTSAWEPVAAHYQQLAEQRQRNVAQAQSLLDDVRQYGVSLAQAAEPDWHALLQFSRDVRQAWRRLGTLDRRDKKRLESEFEAALEQLLQPLVAARAAEAARREHMINEVARLPVAERSAVDQLRALQARWQEQARALPLERRQEQELWQRFRAACDEFFQARKSLVEAADSERQSHLQQAEQLCLQLEQASAGPGLQALLRDSARQWDAVGPLPRASEQAMRLRYAAARAQAQALLDAEHQAREQQRSQALQAKLALCQQAEGLIAGKPAAEVTLQALQGEWQALPPLAADAERPLAARFAAALAAAAKADRAYLQQLQANKQPFARALLRLEIMAGLDSPPELAAERLQLQVEVLQDSLKSGQKPAAQRVQLLQLCALPVALDASLQERLTVLLRQVQA